MKICKDCKHYHKPCWFLGDDFHMCSRDGVVNEVTGKPKGYCDIQRKYSHLCGQEAKYFELKERK